VAGGGRVAAEAVEGIVAKAAAAFMRTTDDIAGEAAQRAAREAGEEAAERAGKEAAQRAGKEAGEEAGEKAAKEAREAAGKAVTKDPIDLATGEVLLAQTDADLPAVLPLVLYRTHLSSFRRGRYFGVSWASTLDQHLEITSDLVTYAAADGAVVRYPVSLVAGEPVAPMAGPGYRTLTLTAEEGYRLTDTRTGHTLHFPAPGIEYGFSRLPLLAITDRNENRIDIVYRDRVPVEVRHSGGYRVAIDTTSVATVPDGDHRMAQSSNGELPSWENASVSWSPGQSNGSDPAVDAPRRRIIGLRLLTGTDNGNGTSGSITLMRFGYNPEGDVAEIINESGRPLKLWYDSEHRLTGWQDRNGCSYTFTYDEQGRAVAGTGTDGNLNTRLEFGDHRTVMTDSLGHRTVYELNDRYQVTAVRDPLGNVTRSEWDERDRLIANTDRLGATMRFTYDEAGHPVEVVRADGSIGRVKYNALNLPVEITDPDGAVWRRSYDEAGNLTEVTDPVGAVTQYRYHRRGHLMEVRDALGAVTRVVTNAAGLPMAVSDPNGRVTRYERDAFGRIVAIIDPLGNVTRHGWRVDGRPAWWTRPDGTSAQLSYDAEGNLVAVTDSLGNTVRTEMGAFDVPVTQIDADGARLTFGYDTELRLTSVTNPQGLIWRYTYDPAGNLAGEIDFNGRELSYRHDAVGQLISRTNAAGQTIEFTYDVLGRITEKRIGDKTTTFSHDAAGRLVAAVSPDADLRYERDARGRVTAEICNGARVESRYDAVGRRIGRRTPTGALSTWAYDHGGLPSSLTTGGQTLTFEYDAAGRETRRWIGDQAVLSQEWDPLGRLTGQALWGRPTSGRGREGQVGGPTLLQHRTYTYRSDDHVTAITDQLTGGRRYDLDRLGRVTAVQARGWQETYAYDAAGNVTRATWPTTSSQDPSHGYGPASPDAVPGGAPAQQGNHGQDDGGATGDREYHGLLLRRAGRVHYDYDAEGRVTLRRNTSLSGKQSVWRYQWDPDDRLIAVQTPDGAVWRYGYDALGRRISKQRRTDTNQVIEQFWFAWDGPTLIEQAHHTWSAQRQEWDTSGTTWEYVPGTFRPLSQTARSPLRDAPQQWIDEKFHAIVTDLVGTPAELVDENGAITWAERTTLWGKAIAPGRSRITCPLRFAGQYHDEETGLHYNYHRYYNPDTARYETHDPLGLTPAPNTQAYVPNPLVWLDPLGLCPTAGRAPSFQVNSKGEAVHVAGLGRPDNNIVISGHGSYGLIGLPGGNFTVPQGTSVTAYCPHGAQISDPLGNAIETGTNANRIPFTQTYGPGESMPNYTISPPDGLNIKGNPITVTQHTPLSQLVQPNMGPTHLATCRYDQLAPGNTKVWDLLP
jgi:RHS repeat-associated protein